jgi:hypothetical protein
VCEWYIYVNMVCVCVCVCVCVVSVWSVYMARMCDLCVWELWCGYGVWYEGVVCGVCGM